MGPCVANYSRGNKFFEVSGFGFSFIENCSTLNNTGRVIPRSRRASPFVAWVGRLVFFLLGWKCKGQTPEAKKFVILAAPHTSNWDGFFLILAAAMLKLETSGTEGEELLRLLEHASHDVRLLAAEMCAASDNPVLREQLAQRTSHEVDRNVRDALEGALSSIRWRGERSIVGS